MKETGLICTGESVRGIRAGRKTQTRRARGLEHINIEPNRWTLGKSPQSYESNDFAFLDMADPIGTYPTLATCPYGKVGDRLWVRETHYRYGKWLKNGKTKTGRQKWRFKPLREKYREIKYFDNPPNIVQKNSYRKEGWYKRVSIFMPKWAARIWLEITSIRLERVQEISEADARAEGVEPYEGPAAGTEKAEFFAPYKASFSFLWDTINAKRGYGWEKNPLVWVLGLRKVIRQ